MEIEAGKEDFKYIEINEPDSIIYIGFALLNYDINFKLLKYKANTNNVIDNPEQSFETVLQVDKINACDLPVKLIVFAPEPGVYKAVWDNSYSWLNSKKMRIRISVLKPIELFNNNNQNNSISNEKQNISYNNFNSKGLKENRITFHKNLNSNEQILEKNNLNNVNFQSNRLENSQIVNENNFNKIKGLTVKNIKDWV